MLYNVTESCPSCIGRIEFMCVCVYVGGRATKYNSAGGGNETRCAGVDH